MLKSSASRYESSGSQFFRTATGIQFRLDAFDKSRLVINHLRIYRNIMQFQISSRQENK